MNNKNIWKELRNLGLLSKARDELHGFSPDQLNTHFARVSVSQTERDVDLVNILAAASNDGFTFRAVTFSDVDLAVAHVSSQAKGGGAVYLKTLSRNSYRS